MNYKSCPKCDASLNALLSSGRQVCSSCKWTELNEKATSKKNKYYQIDVDVDRKKQNTNETSNSVQQESVIEMKQNSGSAGAVILFLLGLLIMVIGLFYDTTTCDKDYGILKSGCTHNIGLIHKSSNILNFGGFLCICGCVLNIKPHKR